MESHKVCCLDHFAFEISANLLIPQLSVGRSLRALAESEPKPLTENFIIKEAITTGEMVSKQSLAKLIHNNILQVMNKKGIIIDGYPRDMNQLHEFEDKVRIRENVWLMAHD